MTGDELERILRDDLDQRRQADQLRRRRIVRPIDSTHLEIKGRSYVNFASNDYLGLSHHPRLKAAAASAVQQAGIGSGAAGLITGYSSQHAAAERAIAAWKQNESAVMLPSGYQANHAAIQTFSALAGHYPGGVRFLMDKLVHASLVDAVRASGLPWRVFPHNHLGKLKRLLEGADAGQLQVVVSESIFSMDGDAADLEGLAELKRRRPFILFLDEAHGSGVYGPDGRGYAAERGLGDGVDVSVVTFSKALGCIGGAVCGSRLFCEALVNHGRAYIYSTSIPPAVAATVEMAIGLVAEEPHRRRRVRQLARQVREQISSAGIAVPPGDSPIVPLIVGSERAALGLAGKLRERGLWTVAVRPPTVPRGGSRVRITISCDHTDEEVQRLVESVKNESSGAEGNAETL